MSNDYLVYDTEAAAQADSDLIFARGKAIFASQGYTTDGDGIIGQSEGVSRPDAQKTTSWAVPIQRVTDDKWVIPHPNQHPAATPEYLAIAMADITASIEQFSIDWLPEVEEI